MTSGQFCTLAMFSGGVQGSHWRGDLRPGNHSNVEILWRWNGKIDCFVKTGGNLIIRSGNPAQLHWLGLLDQDGSLLCQMTLKIGSMMNWNLMSRPLEHKLHWLGLIDHGGGMLCSLAMWEYFMVSPFQSLCNMNEGLLPLQPLSLLHKTYCSAVIEQNRLDASVHSSV